jgi:hypothetical protein
MRESKLTLSSLVKDDFRSESEDLNESLQIIEKKYGHQWDFCDCVLKGDSLNKALQNTKLSEAETSRLMNRFEEIDRRCQAFRITDPNRTPREREAHERKVMQCLTLGRNR